MNIITSINKSSLNPERLIDYCIKGDRECQQILYNQLAPRMMSLCLRYTRSNSEAESVLTTGFVKLFESIRQFKKMESIELWTRKVMVLTAIEHFKKSSPFAHVINVENIHFTIINPVRDELEMLSAEVLIRMIQKLPPAYQMVFNLYSFEKMNHKEIGNLLSISEETSRSHLHDARVILKKVIEKSMQYELASHG